MYFEVTRASDHDHGVTAVSPKHGGDRSLIAVFDHIGAANELADILNHAAREHQNYEYRKLIGEI